jgi:hypothetical protein
MLHDFWQDHPDFIYTFNLIVDYPGESIHSVRNTAAIIGEDPQLFYDHVAACCRFHLYEGTPEFVRLGANAFGCLEGLLPPGVNVPSFRYLFPRVTPDTTERMRIWSAIADFVNFAGCRDVAGERRESAIYD